MDSKHKADKPKPRDTRFTILIDVDTRKELEAVAQRLDLNIGQLIRRAIRETLDKIAREQAGV
jgi:hypothetical protein